MERSAEVLYDLNRIEPVARRSELQFPVIINENVHRNAYKFRIGEQDSERGLIYVAFVL